MAEELKRSDCPFCGENELVQSDTWSSYLGRYVETVECKCCGASAPEDKWNTRAQLPSQGGEAVEVVGWRRLDRPYELTAYPSVCAMWHGAGYPVQALYTHPAGQVADDLTMVKVSRELLQDLRDLAFDQVEHHRAAMGAYKQTRQSAMDSVLAQADALLNGGRS